MAIFSWYSWGDLHWVEMRSAGIRQEESVQLSSHVSLETVDLDAVLNELFE
ncbi:hypothetical protein [Pseudomonas sp. PDM16]|uniref:hypothetical protein n=1 Tax=Pseudomonas sp. PDM16 TaxID=2769292 RepID=UPI00399B78A2